MNFRSIKMFLELLQILYIYRILSRKSFIIALKSAAILKFLSRNSGGVRSVLTLSASISQTIKKDLRSIGSSGWSLVMWSNKVTSACGVLNLSIPNVTAAGLYSQDIKQRLPSIISLLYSAY